MIKTSINEFKVMRNITSITQGDESITVNFSDGEFAVVAKFGQSLYSSTSPNVLKSTLVNIKKDIQEFGLDSEILSKLYIKNYGN